MSLNNWKQSTLVRSICLVLGLVTLALYWPTFHHPFITLDDNQYVTENPHVLGGLTWAGIKWALTSNYASNWHPITWISHMMDCQLFGKNAGGHHLINVLFHIANTLLLFVWLNKLTGALWRSALVAALFAWHPLHIESVAWAAERKDVLSAFFWLLTLIAYSRYIREIQPAENTEGKKSTTRRPTFYYVLALMLFALGLMSKPMVVTLPFVLLLIDFWPAKRINLEKFSASAFGVILLEKLPFFALTVGDCILNMIAQKGSGATWTFASLPMHVRLANAVISYVRYISKTFWPTDLAIIYPFQNHWPLSAVIGSALFLLICSGLAILCVRRGPFLFFGWFYFIGTLVPVIGIIQVGPQAMADRYMYLPSIGLFIAIIWGASELLSKYKLYPKIAPTIGALACAGCLICTSHQLGYWSSSIKLFAHTVAVTKDNYAALDYLGGALEAAGRQDEALYCYQKSVEVTPRFPLAQWNLGMSLLHHHRNLEASEHLAVASRFAPKDPVILCYYGRALMLAGKMTNADEQFSKALALKPDYLEAHVFFALNLALQNKITNAIPHFEAATRLSPNDAEIRFNYGLALLDNHQPTNAAIQFAKELELTPDSTKAHYRLAQALERQGKIKEAAAHYEAALKLTPNFPEAKTALDAILTNHPELKH